MKTNLPLSELIGNNVLTTTHRRDLIIILYHLYKNDAPKYLSTFLKPVSTLKTGLMLYAAFSLNKCDFNLVDWNMEVSEELLNHPLFESEERSPLLNFLEYYNEECENINSLYQCWIENRSVSSIIIKNVKEIINQQKKKFNHE